jgi:hypothetical protein
VTRPASPARRDHDGTGGLPEAAYRWYKEVGVRPSAPFNRHEVAMSADRDRGIRRQKQKRAKDLKRDARTQRQQAAGAQPGSTKSATEQKAG